MKDVKFWFSSKRDSLKKKKTEFCDIPPRVSCTQSFTPWLADEIVFEGKAVFDFDQLMLVIYPPTIRGG